MKFTTSLRQVYEIYINKMNFFTFVERIELEVVEVYGKFTEFDVKKIKFRTITTLNLLRAVGWKFKFREKPPFINKGLISPFYFRGCSREHEDKN